MRKRFIAAALFCIKISSMWTILLLIGSNIFMAFAWYGSLKVSRSGPVGGHSRELVRHPPRVLPGGSLEQHRREDLLSRFTQGDPEGHHSLRFWGFQRVLLWRQASLEPLGLFACLVAGVFFMFHKF